MATASIVQSQRDVITITAGGTYTAKTPIKIGSALFGIPMASVVSGGKVAVAISGSWDLAKSGGTGVTFAVGARVYWNQSGETCTADTDDDDIGVCVVTAANADTDVSVLLNGSIDTAGDAISTQLFDANTILAANTDDTPAAVTMAVQTVLGRITGGNIKALSVAELQTLANVEDGADVTDAANVTAAGAVMDSELIYQEITVASGTTTKSDAVAGGQTDGKPVIASIQSKGANAAYVTEAGVTGGNLVVTVNTDPGAGDCVIGTWTDNR